VQAPNSAIANQANTDCHLIGTFAAGRWTMSDGW
jgi:hypothetical protein